MRPDEFFPAQGTPFLFKGMHFGLHFCQEHVFFLRGPQTRHPLTEMQCTMHTLAPKMVSRGVLELPLGGIWHALSVQGCTLRNAFLQKSIHFKLVRGVLGPSWATPWSQESMGRSALPYDPRGNLRHECLRVALMGAPATCRPRGMYSRMRTQLHGSGSVGVGWGTLGRISAERYACCVEVLTNGSHVWAPAILPRQQHRRHHARNPPPWATGRLIKALINKR